VSPKIVWLAKHTPTRDWRGIEQNSLFPNLNLCSSVVELNHSGFRQIMKFTKVMRLMWHSILAAVLTATAPWLPAARAGSETGAPARVFNAPPGTNTLMLARDAVRAWRAQRHAEEAATLLLAPGEYALTETLTLDARDHDETWTTPDAQRVLITGGRRITGFAADPAGVWHASTGLRFEQLYVNDRRATRAHLPATGYFAIETVRQEDLPAGKVRLIVKLPAGKSADSLPDPSALRDAQILVFHKWDTSRYRISALDPAAGTITTVGERMQTWNPWDARSRFILDNCLGGHPLPPGIWFLDPQGALSYCPRSGEQMGKAEVIAPLIGQFIMIDGAANVRFNNLRFRHAGYELPAGGCPPGQAAAAIQAAIQADHARNVAFEHCEISHIGIYGLWFRQGCHDCRIEHCLLEDLGAGGVRIGEMAIRDEAREQTDGIVVDNNIIRRCGRIHPSAVGVWVGQSANNRITHNDINDTFYTGISVGWTWGYGRSLATNNLIGSNRIHRIGQGVLSDMGGIYTLGVSPGSANIGNVIFDVRAHDYGGWGIYPDEGSSGWQIASNLVWHCTCLDPHSGGAFHQHYGATNLIANNIFALSSGPPMQATRVEDHLSFVLERNVIVSSNAAFFTGPWDKIEFQGRSNCFVSFGTLPPRAFPNSDLAQWQKAGHESGSILTNCGFNGFWPNIKLPPRSPVYTVGFKTLAPEHAGVYGDRAWRRVALETKTENDGPITAE